MKLLYTLFTGLLFSQVYSYENFYVSPESYRGWFHVKSMIIYDKNHPLYDPFGGIHHVYVNNTGLEKVKMCKNRKFPEGSVLVFVLYEIVNKDGTFSEGLKKIEAFMIKDSKKYKHTDGWGYFAYIGNKNIVKDMKNQCHSCHSQVKNKDFIFSCWTR